jgi:peptidyl-prolyl cis-trans isomerase D
MLRDIKQQSSGLGFKIVMALIIISFVFWGVGSSLISAGNDSAAKVNGEKVTISDFNQANQSSRNRLQQQFGDNLGIEYFESVNFKRGVLNQIVDRELLKQQAQKFDYDVAPETIKNYIEASPGLQIEGKFSKEAYANYLAQANKSAELLQRDIKDDIIASALPQLVSNSAFAVKSEIESQFKLSKQKRSYDYIELNNKDYEDKVEISEEEIANHYNEFGTDYMTAEQVSVNYIELSTADLLDDMTVSDEEIQNFYDAKKETLLTAEKRNAQHILLPVNGDEEDIKVEIDKVAARITNGEDFAAVAKEVSQDPGSAKDGGNLGWVAKGDMVEAFDDKLFSMNVGDISEPVLSSFGYHIIKLSEIKSPEVPAIEEIKDSLIEELKLEKAEVAFLTKADELTTIVIDSDNVLELAAEDSGLAIKTTELFAKGFGVGTAANQNFSTAAFSDLVKIDGETSEMIDLGENHIAYLHVAEHNPPVIKALEDVKDSITKKLKSEKALELLKQTVAGYVEKINAGETNLADVATELGKEVVQSVDIERVGSKEPFNLVKNVFNLKLIEDKPLITSVDSSNNAMAIVALKAIVNAEAADLTDEESTSIATQIQRTVSNNEMTNITANLRNEASINVNESIFEEVEQ